MKLTFLGNRYDSEPSTFADGQLTPYVGKYRGVEFIAMNQTVPMSASRQRKYRGIAY